MKLFMLLALVALSAAQVPKPCYGPQMFEARVVDYYPANNEFLRSRLSVDGFQHRIYVHEERILGQTTTSFDFIQLYDQGVTFTFNTQFGNCSRAPLPQKWQDFFGIPTGASFYAEDYMGSGVQNNGVLVNIWGGNDTSGRTYGGAWTSDACIPVFQMSNSPRSGSAYWNFYDVTFGIANPNVFIPPSYCPTS